MDSLIKNDLLDTRTVNVVILTGGKGTRLRSVLSDKPKVLAEVNSRPFLTYILDQLIKFDFREVVFCSGYMADAIGSYFGSHYKQLNIEYSREETPLGTGGALRHALPKLSSSILLVMNGDSYVDANLVTFVKSFSQKRLIAKMLLTEVDDVSRFGSVQFSNEMMITSFKEKGAQKGPGWINAGVYLLKKSLIEEIPEERFFSLEKDLFPELSGRGLFGYCTNGDFIDIGTPDSYATAESFFAKH
jgi:D-glycero-alpha-D-manno-heptose 1-phosphate guanylyltransferase